jgi:hypothetical protein
MFFPHFTALPNVSDPTAKPCIKTDVNEIGCEDLNRIGLVQDSDMQGIS